MPVTTGVALGVKGLAIGVFAWQGHIIISQLFIAYYNLAHCFISRYLCDQGSSAMGYCIHLQPLSTSFFNLTTVSLFLQWATIERLMMFSVIFVIIWTSAWKYVLYIHLWCWYWLWLMRHDSAMNQKTDFYLRVLMFDYRSHHTRVILRSWTTQPQTIIFGQPWHSKGVVFKENNTNNLQCNIIMLVSMCHCNHHTPSNTQLTTVLISRFIIS